MKRKTFTPQQIASILQEFENGKSVVEISREQGVSQAAFYKWRQRYNGMDATELKRLKELEEENRCLKQMYADVSLDLKLAKEIIEKSFKAQPKEAACKRALSTRTGQHPPGVPRVKPLASQFIIITPSKMTNQ